MGAAAPWAPAYLYRRQPRRLSRRQKRTSRQWVAGLVDEVVRYERATATWHGRSWWGDPRRIQLPVTLPAGAW